MGNLVGREIIRKHVKTCWDYVKHLMALVDSGFSEPAVYDGSEADNGDGGGRGNLG